MLCLYLAGIETRATASVERGKTYEILAGSETRATGFLTR